MQWNIQEMEKWEELQPFVDTALLPLYLYRPDTKLVDHVMRTSYLLNVAASIEQKLKGRVLLFPLCYQFGHEPIPQQFPAGFQHCILLQFSGDDIKLLGQEARRLTVGDEDLDSPLRFEVTVDILTQEVIRMWQEK
ncbi:DUF2487 family protein [Brevibacillus borstelensis]|jgi:hypothetical protein|uniref:DUF2487 family protein n=1 Tax=Brevibacillus borstelensis TaxID=45462 RepID=UPI000F0854BE|nr:DUF2487 family protein [Brevibacillus borstelensis]MED1745247.1 DUF2487 family protein [Brevibacillus borstelensis]MED1882619.1 DUF2487 family protein [Brevibacillus borstelensis]MED2011420.1 DUF2487 family protein [Brevibacillus borstelensis]RNB62233.1 DUF2487 family protein [Brevibacillus borstelensis]GED51652.1 hypothetical protein BBO01nite_08930 [Brevibacillus borstelensis]